MTIAATVRHTVTVTSAPTRASMPAQGGRRHRGSDEQPRCQFLRQDLRQVTQPRMPGGQSAYQSRSDLGTRITAGPDQQGDEERQRDDGLHLVFERSEHRSGVGLGDEEHEEPDDALTPQPRRRGLKIQDFQRRGAALALSVRSRLLRMMSAAMSAVRTPRSLRSSSRTGSAVSSWSSSTLAACSASTSGQPRLGRRSSVRRQSDLARPAPGPGIPTIRSTARRHQ